MVTCPGYKVLRSIHHGTRNTVYLAVSEQDGKQIALKTTSATPPSTQDNSRLRNEFDITASLNVEGIIKPQQLLSQEQGLILVLPYYGDESLAADIGATNRDPILFLRYALQITHALSGIHQQGVIHLDIKPSNIILDRSTEKLTIVDFGAAKRMQASVQAGSTSEVLEGSLLYMSPEQTGRINRIIDYRSDLYSLGVTFYEMLTGAPPFVSRDPLEIVHAHIARMPVPPEEINPAVPSVLSEITLRLLEKDAESRYQSAIGLQFDLQECMRQVEAGGSLRSFPLGKNDIPDRFTIPQKLFGREIELEILMDAFGRVGQGQSEAIIISGCPGIGKSVLVNEMQRPVLSRSGYFATGKFEPFKRDVPYGGFVDAFRSLIRQIMMESQERIDIWRRRLLNALGVNGQVIIEVIPELEWIIGSQPPIEELPPTEAHNRFTYFMGKFMGLFCRRGHPLVIFLDDIQWADTASLNLIQNFTLNDDEYTNHMLAICAYRDSEVQTGEPLAHFLDELQTARIRITYMEPQPFSESDLGHLLAETLHHDPNSMNTLVDKVISKTGGNPFFVIQLLQLLHKNGALAVNPETGQWGWDEVKVEQTGFTDNIIDLMAGRISGLSPEAQGLLRLAACFGSEFNLKGLAAVGQHTEQSLLPVIEEIKDEGLIISTEMSRAGSMFCFIHNRVQQAAYNTIAEDERRILHYRIGTLLLSEWNEETVKENVFDIVNHLNQAPEQCDRSQRMRLAALNLMAGKKACTSVAFQLAFRHVKMALGLLTSDDWQTEYELALDIHMRILEYACINGEFTEAQAAFEVILCQARSDLEKARAYALQTMVLTSTGRFTEAINSARAGLKLCGVYLPVKARRHNILQEYIKCRLYRGKKDVKELIGLPPITDPLLQEAISLLSSLQAAVYVSDVQLGMLTQFKIVSLSIKNGNAPESCLGYAALSMTQMATFKRFEEGHSFALLAMSMAERSGELRLMSRVQYLLGSFLLHWVEPIRKCNEYLLSSIDHSIATGDMIFVGNGCFAVLRMMIFMGEPLESVRGRISEYMIIVKRAQYAMAVDYLEIYDQFAKCLQGCTRNPTSFDSDDFNETDLVGRISARGVYGPQAFYRIYKAIVYYLNRQYREAFALHREVEPLINTGGMYATTNTPEHYFYYALNAIALYSEASPAERRELKKIIRTSRNKMRMWSGHSSENYESRYLLLEAEYARLKNRQLDAIRLYDQSIRAAERQKSSFILAIANESAGRFHLSRGGDSMARAYLRDSRRSYQELGAFGQVAALQRQYSLILTPETPIDAEELQNSTTTGSLGLDIASVMKAAQTLSQEMRVDQLLDKMVGILLENAGAQKGVIILNRNNQLVVMAQGEINDRADNNMQDSGITQEIKPATKPDAAVMQGVPLEESNIIPRSLIHYVDRTHESVLLDAAADSEWFTMDPYLAEAKPKSALCMPVINKGQVISVLYLENNAIGGAFTPERVSTLKLLSSQLAISIENAVLYQNLQAHRESLEQTVKERIQELEAAQRELAESEKMAALGQLVAGIAHEINTPLGAINSSVGSIAEAVQTVIEQIPDVLTGLSPADREQYMHLMNTALTSDGALPTREKRAIRKSLNEVLERAGIPNASAFATTLVSLGIHHYSEDMRDLLLHPRSREIFDSLNGTSNLIRGVKNIQTATMKARKIVFALKSFARFDSSGEKVEADLREGIETVLTLYYHQIKQGTELIRDYEEITPIPCYPDELNQVWTNLINNALQAMDYKGTLTIRVRQSAGETMVAVQDTGHGMSDEVKEKIFKPFFTTKRVGEGSGLGLDIVSKIIEKHEGRIKVESEVGRGTTFTVTLPATAKITGEPEGIAKT